MTATGAVEEARQDRWAMECTEMLDVLLASGRRRRLGCGAYRRSYPVEGSSLVVVAHAGLSVSLPLEVSMVEAARRTFDAVCRCSDTDVGFVEDPCCAASRQLLSLHPNRASWTSTTRWRIIFRASYCVGALLTCI